MITLDFAEVRTHFAALHALSAAEQRAGLRAIVDPALRAEVASLLQFDAVDTPFVQDMPADPSDDVTAPPIGGATLDARYEVQTRVAEGGFGWVYRGLTVDGGAPVAIKVFKPITDPAVSTQIEAAFEREAAVLESLADSTPHIVRYHGSGVFDGEDRRYVYIVMEWLDGLTLQARPQPETPLSLGAAATLLTPIARALAVAHANGIAHRDLKPSNIMCTGDPSAPVLKLIDFGAAKRAADRARGFDSTGGALGMVTFHYSAPEQLDKTHGPSGPWTDVHALALLLVELIAGRHPWAQLDVLLTMQAVGAKTRPTPRRLGLEVSKAVEGIFAQALHRDPRKRYREAGAFWAALTDALTDRGRPSLRDRLRRRR